MATTDPTTLLTDDAQLETLCRGFLASRYYRKAIEDIRYRREQAISDFLSEHLPKQKPAEPGQLEAIVVAIRRNYYRYF